MFSPALQMLTWSISSTHIDFYFLPALVNMQLPSIHFPQIFKCHLFMAMLGLCCCARAFSSCSRWGVLLSCVAWASHHGGFSCCQACTLGQGGFRSCAPPASLLHSTWDLPGPGIEPLSPALACRLANDWTTWEVPFQICETHLEGLLKMDIPPMHP